MFFITEAADENADAAKARPLRGDRGAHFTLAITGSELDAPRQTPTTDLELFIGLGLDLAGGYRFGRFRIEGEWHLHHSERSFTGDSVDLRALMVNGYADFRLSKSLNFFLGAGVGNAKVDVEIDTCLDLLGCPALSLTDASANVSAYQYMIGLGFSPEGALPAPSIQYFIGFRMFQTADLGITDSLGVPFSDDRVKMPMAIFGFTKRFKKRSSTPPG